VLVTAVLALAVGSVWYSPVVFGRAWMRAARLTEEDLALSKERLASTLVSAFLVNLIVLSTLGYFSRILADGPLTPSAMSAWFFVVAVGVLAVNAIWEQRPVSYIFIHAGYVAIVLLGGMQVITLWPW